MNRARSLVIYDIYGLPITFQSRRAQQQQLYNSGNVAQQLIYMHNTETLRYS